MERSTQSTIELCEHKPRNSWIRPSCAMTSCQLFPDSKGPAGGSDFVGMIVAAMPDFRLEIEDIFGAGDRAAVRLRMTGTHSGPAFPRSSSHRQEALGKCGVYLSGSTWTHHRSLAND